MTGDITPDLTGYFFENGTEDGSPAYERADGGAWLFADTGTYALAVAKGDIGNEFFANQTPTIPAGTYDPYNGATGTATVEAVIE